MHEVLDVYHFVRIVLRGSPWPIIMPVCLTGLISDSPADRQSILSQGYLHDPELGAPKCTANAV